MTEQVTEQAAIEQKAKTNTAKNTKPATKRKPERQREELSTPTIEIPISLSTLQAQNVYKRTIQRGYVPSALFSLGVIMHIIGTPKEAEETEQIVFGKIKAVQDELTQAIDALEKRLSEAGAQVELNYTVKLNETVKVEAPLVIHYVNLILSLEQLVKLVDSMWMMQLMSSGKRMATNFDWQRTLTGLANHIIELQRRAHAAAVNKGKAEELAQRNITAVATVSENDEDDTEELEQRSA